MAQCSQQDEVARLIICNSTRILSVQRRFLLLILGLFLPVIALAQKWELTERVPVYSSLKDDAQILFYLEAGEPFERAKKEVRGYRKIKVIKNGRARVGYIQDVIARPARPPMPREDQWAIGAGLGFARLTQDSRRFKSQDNVQWTINEQESQSFNYNFSIQRGLIQFWRLQGQWFTADFSTTAKNDVNQIKKAKTQHTFLAGTFQYGWGFQMRSKHPVVINYGVGLDIYKAMQSKLLFDNENMPLSDTEKPVYFGGHGFVGAQIQLAPKIWAAADLRVGMFLNQTPSIFQIQALASVFYWL